MNLGVGKVSSAARRLIEGAGGSVEPAANPELFLVQLPDSVRSTEIKEGLLLVLPGIGTLRFARAWETKDCRLETEEETSNFFEKGREVGKALAVAFPGNKELSASSLALTGFIVAGLITDQRDHKRYIDGFVAGFYEVNPVEPMGISI